MKTRKEQDALGAVNVPENSYGGSFYTRAKENFQISQTTAPGYFKTALAWVKMAAAKVNSKLGDLDKKSANAIIEAGKEFIDGKFDDDFDLDAYQAGAGTAYNMNLNEILANRANELLGSKKGEYNPVHPNDHCNMSQSSNDVIPTATRIAALMALTEMEKSGAALLKSFKKKAKEFKSMKKLGRTHLQDAVPTTLGNEFGAYASAIERALKRIHAAGDELRELGIGGTAIGSGVNVHNDFAGAMCKELSRLSDFDFWETKNKFELTHSMAGFLNLSSSLRGLAVELHRIMGDLRMMSSGPRGSLNEISLPEVQPGSSIMPGKVNPSITECMSMICAQVIGLDHSISMATHQGQFELNWFTPLIMMNLMHQIEILGNGMKMLDEKCISGIEANEERMLKLLSKSTAYATALVPKMGYKKVAELVKESIEKDIPLDELASDL
jgi:aspartate ammonia-lyase